jgi:hypothetical protein
LIEHGRDAIALVPVLQVGKTGKRPKIGDTGCGSRIRKGIAVTMVAEPPDRDDFPSVGMLPQDKKVVTADAVQCRRLSLKHCPRPFEAHRFIPPGSSMQR